MGLWHVSHLSLAVLALPLLGLSGCAPHVDDTERANGERLTTNTCAEKARTFSGDPAKGLIQALMFAGVTPSHAGTDEASTDTYSLPSLSCQEAHVLDDGISRFECATPKITNEATAKVLFDAIYGLKIAPDAGLGHVFAEVNAVSCTLSFSTDGAPSYKCTGTALWEDDCE
jgi:hypothetical protein